MGISAGRVTEALVLDVQRDETPSYLTIIDVSLVDEPA